MDSNPSWTCCSRQWFFVFNHLAKEKPLSNSSKTQGKHPKVRFLSSALKNPGFPRVFRISGQLLWLSCLSMHVHACRCCVVLCAALPPGESSSESPESSSNPRFSRENLLFCSGGAGFELVEFESYWYSMLEQRCRACSRRPSIQVV
jgi:hypothetical protein